MSKDKQYKHLINSQRWRSCRDRQLRLHPLCQRCEKEGRIRLAEEVHHIRPIESVHDYMSMEALAYDMNNLMSVCCECHHDIHAEMMSHSKESVRRNNERKTEQFMSKYLKK